LGGLQKKKNAANKKRGLPWGRLIQKGYRKIFASFPPQNHRHGNTLETAEGISFYL
jgi:hypothetical protein